jgi:hypothetical protein
MNLFLNAIQRADKYFYFDSSSTFQGLLALGLGAVVSGSMLVFADSTVRYGTCRCSAQWVRNILQNQFPGEWKYD